MSRDCSFGYMFPRACWQFALSSLSLLCDVETYHVSSRPHGDRQACSILLECTGEFFTSKGGGGGVVTKNLIFSPQKKKC